MNHYAEAIEILRICNEADRMLFEIAKKHPKVVTDAYTKIHRGPTNQWIIEMAKAGASRIECIKAYREREKVSLAAAKVAVEALHNF